jgi:hypothetical protein
MIIRGRFIQNQIVIVFFSRNNFFRKFRFYVGRVLSEREFFLVSGCNVKAEMSVAARIDDLRSSTWLRDKDSLR